MRSLTPWLGTASGIARYRRQKGSHQRDQHPDGRRVTVTFHASSDTFPIGTLKEMINQAGWTEEDLIRLILLNQ